MKSISNFFAGVAKGARRLNQGGAKTNKVFRAYEAKDYETMISMLSSMSAQQFTRDLRKEEMTLLHHCAIDDNVEAL
jgi:hypothetical protein